MRTAPFLLALALTSCATAPHRSDASDDGIARAHLGETAYVDGPRVTPLKVLEDSRCPKEVHCVWAGRLRLEVRIDLGSGSQVRELTLREPQQVADGSLELIEATPDRLTDQALDPEDYRFGFRFMGGL